MLVSLLICSDVLMFQVMRDPALDAYFFALLTLYIILLSVFKLITHGWKEPR